jgi:hypothetical protein
MPKGSKAVRKKKAASAAQTPLVSKKASSVAIQPQPISSSLGLLHQSTALLWLHKKLFAGILVSIGIVQLIVVEGIVRTDFVAINKQVQEALGGGQYSLENGVVSYAYLLGSGQQAGGTGVAQTIFIVATILALVWALREITAGNRPRVRDAFYKSMTPLVPFILVLLWLGLQLIPVLIGAGIFSLVTTNGIAVHTYEYVLWLVLFIVLATLSVRLILGTIFALYAVTLPDMAPWAAIQGGRTLVDGRRWLVLRKIFILTIILAVGMTVVLLPSIMAAPVIVPVLFYALSLVAGAIGVTYVYKLYKELL